MFCSGQDDEPADENPDEIETYDNDEGSAELINGTIAKNASNNSSFRSHKFSDPPSDM